MSRPITVRLVGGLGNQLFGYYAGAALAGHLGVDLRLDVSWTRHGLTDHGIEILKLDLPGQWLSNDSRSSRAVLPGSALERVWGNMIGRFPWLRRPLRIHEATEIGNDPDLFFQPPGTRLRGYFQSWRTVQSAVDRGYPRRPNLRTPSDWLDETTERAERDKPLVVHVRRGDYAQVPEFGLLGPGYYEPSIQRLLSGGVTGPLWLFSDDLDAAAEALGRFADRAVPVASPDGPVTEMLAMSHAGAHVIGNSTFSWWGAWMNPQEPPVVAPEPWFKSGPLIDGLIPPSWIELPANFAPTAQ